MDPMPSPTGEGIGVNGSKVRYKLSFISTTRAFIHPQNGGAATVTSPASQFSWERVHRMPTEWVHLGVASWHARVCLRKSQDQPGLGGTTRRRPSGGAGRATSNDKPLSIRLEGTSSGHLNVGARGGHASIHRGKLTDPCHLKASCPSISAGSMIRWSLAGTCPRTRGFGCFGRLFTWLRTRYWEGNFAHDKSR